MNDSRKECVAPYPGVELPFRTDRFNRVYIEMSPKETLCKGCNGVVPAFTSCICTLTRESGSFNFCHWK